MNIQTFGRYLFIVSIAATATAGCGGPHAGAPQSGAQDLPVLTSTIDSGKRPGDPSLRGETFTSTASSAHCYIYPEGPYNVFSASGTAAGPFPGTFSASGRVSSFAPPPPFTKTTLTYHESFTIKSGSQTISGTVDKSAPPNNGISFACPVTAFHLIGATYNAGGTQGVSGATYSAPRFTESFSGAAFTGAFSGNVTTAGSCTSGATFGFTGTGSAAFLGAGTESGTVKERATFPAPCWPQSSTYTLTSSLVSTDKITITVYPGSSWSCDGTHALPYNVAGGTGKFAGAAGNGTLTISCSGSRYSDKWAGVIRL